MNYFRKTEPTSGVLVFFFLQTKLMELNEKAKRKGRNRLKFSQSRNEGVFLPKERKREKNEGDLGQRSEETSRAWFLASSCSRKLR